MKISIFSAVSFLSLLVANAQSDLSQIRFLRHVGTNVYDSRSAKWEFILGDVITAENGNAIMNRGNQTVALTNYQREITSGSVIAANAIKVGIYKYGSTPIQLWDCGIPYVLTSEQIAAANAAAEKAKADAKAKAIEQKKLAEARALQANQDAAAKGDSFGLLRMGERYRDGEGVEKDLTKAREYLQKSVAADTNNFIAKEELSKLESK